MAVPLRDGWPEAYQEAARAAGKESWPAWCEEIEAERGYVICGAKTGGMSRAPGTPCPNRPGKNQTGRCMSHGDRRPAGEAAPNWKHGRRSRSKRVVGRSLRERLETSLEQDPRRIMAMGATVLLARFDELVDRIDAGAGGADTIAHARDLIGKIRGAQVEPEAVPALLAELEETIRVGARTDAIWAGEFYKLVDLMGQHAERHRRVMEAAGEYVERERAVQLFARFGRDVVDAIEGAEDVPAEAKIALRRKVAGIIMGYLNRPQLPAVQVPA
jgi:hypothetical protein